MNSFLACELLTRDFGVAIVFISMNSEVKCNSIDISEEDITSSFFGISKSTWWNVWYQSTYITETFTKLSWTLDKVDENEFNLIKKYVCTARRFRASDVSNLEAVIPSAYKVTFHILRLAYASGRIWSVTLQPSD